MLGPRLAIELRAAREAIWSETLTRTLRGLRRSRDEAATSGKSAPWKLAAVAKMKVLTTVTNRWLTQQLHMGNLREVSRKVNAWIRSVDKESEI